MATTSASGLPPASGHWRGWRTGKDIPRRAKSTVAKIEIDIRLLNPRVVRSLRQDLRRIATEELRMKHYKSAGVVNAGLCSLDNAILTASAR